jgi:hypothetical protein
MSASPEAGVPRSEGRPDLNRWLDQPAVRIVHWRGSRVEPGRLWEAARSIRLDQTRLLGRLVRWRIPGVGGECSFEQLFTSPPFLVLQDEGMTLLSGMVGRIWTLRRDYPMLTGSDEYRDWHQAGTAKVLFANWVRPRPRGGATVHSESRVQAYGRQGRVGLTAVRPLIRSFQGLVATDALTAVVRLAER